MAASHPQGVMAPTSSLSISFQMESESVPSPKLVDLARFLGFGIEIWEFWPADHKVCLVGMTSTETSHLRLL